MHTFANPGAVVARARQVEDWSFAGLLVADSQCLNADVWVELGLASAATRRLRLGPGVTNPATRHVAVTASAAATLQAESGGRAVLGIGRGDSALTQIGREPVSVAALERSLEQLGGLLRGQEVDVEGHPVRVAVADAVGTPPPIDVAATGPRTIAAAARVAERITFTVGAEPDRLRWAVGVARAASEEHGRDPGELALGAYVNVAVDDNVAAACELVRGSTAIFARFSAEGAPPDGLSDVTRPVIARVGAAYDDAQHGLSTASHATAMPDEFIERFALVGPAATVSERLAELAALGLDHIVVVTGSRDADPERVDASDERFAVDVLPGLAAL